jgi:adenylate kinase
MAPGAAPLNPNVLLLGIQGSGKGTQAKRIAAEYDIPHIATGEILRQAIADGTPLGRRVREILERGDLVPDETMIDLIRERLAQAFGFVLDGFPRTMAQADALDEMLDQIGKPLTIVFELQVPDDVARERMSKRAADEGRSDDTPDVIDRRIELYHRETEPIVQHYRLRGNLVGIHGTGTVDQVFSEIQEALEQAAQRRAEAPVRAGGPGEGVWGNREVPPAGTGTPR